MVAQASNAIGRQRERGVIGSSRGFHGTGGDAVQRHRGSDGGVEADDLTRLTLGFGGSGRRLGRGQGRDLFGAVKPSSGQVEWVPSKAEPAQRGRHDREGRDPEGEPTQRGQRSEERRRQGNTFRSSSKCGPSRSRGQSPPQTRATPLALAAALIASAMRG